jgi:hypothetical protein
MYFNINPWLQQLWARASKALLIVISSLHLRQKIEEIKTITPNIDLIYEKDTLISISSYSESSKIH